MTARLIVDSFAGGGGASTGIEMALGRSPEAAFRVLWNSLNAARGHGWDANPWVVALTFDVARRNIDQQAAA